MLLYRCNSVGVWRWYVTFQILIFWGLRPYSLFKIKLQWRRFEDRFVPRRHLKEWAHHLPSSARYRDKPIRRLAHVVYLDAFAIWRNATVSFVMSVCPSARPHGTTRLRLDGFSCHLIFEYFSKICRENSSFIEVKQEKRVLYMATNTRVFSYLAQFFLEWNIFQKNLYRKSKHTFHIQWLFFFRKSCRLEIMWKYIDKWQYGACALHSGYLSLHIQTQNM